MKHDQTIDLKSNRMDCWTSTSVGIMLDEGVRTDPLRKKHHVIEISWGSVPAYHINHCIGLPFPIFDQNCKPVAAIVCATASITVIF